jgi:hypothetical protein
MSRFGYATLLSVLAVLGAVCSGCSKQAANPPVVSGKEIVEEEVVEEVDVPALDSNDVTEAMAALDEADRAAALAQKVCPVSDEALGSMGTPIKVKVGDRDVFICCESCRDGLLAEPDKYLAKLDANKKP